ncbi:peptide-methionine (S)-S-oxide reductase MsrA [Hymenobacter defluvii]|uniref:Peptide methionine sulfoxide reductase MsrA n=1 Tax=Hymenobacter defluvii TaxID=2054411 RepID=A0ABS3T976_9BACT|nr:peptide-methionine (S)-S-oxide reductase MsrA [Hymenobacter defluvii]MBO3270189.1 peptide-methionine (S)-S-oxide reductase MsrA [Hymenobacter defluvii]
MKFFQSLLLVLATVASTACAQQQSPDALKPASLPKNTQGLAVATFAGGCFWSVQETFREVRGVRETLAGYAGGKAQNPTYEEVAGQGTGHAESVQVYYDPKQVSYQQLLDVFFLGAHNPTELNYQGPDRGPEYRSVAFYRTPQEKQQIEAEIKKINASRHYGTEPVVTQVTPIQKFWPAESYHQGFYRKNPNQGYIANVSRPKVEKFRKAFPNLLKADVAAR